MIKMKKITVKSYILSLIPLLFLLLCILYPKIKFQQVENQAFFPFLQSMKNRTHELYTIDDGMLEEYLAAVEFKPSTEPLALEVTSRSIIDCISLVNHTMNESMEKEGITKESNEYEKFYADHYWDYFYQCLEQIPEVTHTAHITLINSNIDFANGNNSELIGAMLGLTKEDYLDFIDDLRIGESLAIKEGRMSEDERTPGLIW